MDFIGNKVVCTLFSGSLKRNCDDLIDVIGQVLIDGLLNKDNSDVICDNLNMCTGFTQCKLHPNAKSARKSEVKLTTAKKVAAGKMLPDWV